jgi:alpha-glucosidase
VLSNHDITRHVTRYGGGAAGPRRARAAALLMLALPGGAYVYQGEELGLAEVEDLPEEVLQDPVWERSGHTQRGRDGCRVPIPWTASGSSYGFGDDGSWLPQPGEWAKLSVEAQTGGTGSTLELYRSALRLRRAESALGEGPLRWLSSPGGTLVFARDPDVVCAVNLSAQPLSLPSYGDLLIASESLDNPATLPQDTAAWYRLG